MTRFILTGPSDNPNRGAWGAATPDDDLAEPEFVDQITAEARWRVYNYDVGQWQPVGTASDTQQEAEQQRGLLVGKFPHMRTAVVRETTTRTLEAQP